MRREIIRFKLNEPITVKFKFSKPIGTEGKFGEQFYYGVKWDGKEAGIYATETLHKMLQATGSLYNSELEIEKVETSDGKFHWTIRKDGEDITPVLGKLTQREAEEVDSNDSKFEDFETRLAKIERFLWGDK